MNPAGPGDGALSPEKLRESLVSEVAKGKDESVLNKSELKVIAHAVKIWGSLSNSGRATNYNMIKDKVFQEIELGKEGAWNLENVTEENTSAVQDVYKKTVNKSKLDVLKSEIEKAYQYLNRLINRLNPSQQKDAKVKKELEAWKSSGQELGVYLSDRTSQLNQSKLQKIEEKEKVDKELGTTFKHNKEHSDLTTRSSTLKEEIDALEAEEEAVKIVAEKNMEVQAMKQQIDLLNEEAVELGGDKIENPVQSGAESPRAEVNRGSG